MKDLSASNTQYQLIYMSGADVGFKIHPNCQEKA